jgi:hypothetical protein
MMRTLIWTITCTAPLELWAEPFDFDELTPEQQKLFHQDKIPCREYGTLSHLCDDCQFGNIEADEEYSHGL